MVEIRGINEYRTYSGGSDRSKKGGAKEGAEFSELVNAGNDRRTGIKVEAAEEEADRGTVVDAGTVSAVYDGMGRPIRTGMFAGRLFDVHV